MNAPSPDLVSLHRLTFSTPGLGAKLLAIYGSAEQVLREFDPRFTPVSKAQGEKLLSVARSDDHARRVASDLKWHDHSDCQILASHDPHYPKRLLELHDPPLILFVRGDWHRLSDDQIAIVGSRRASAGGMSSAGTFAADLAACGFTVTSGLALGIDGAAHRGALSAGGQTIAVQAIGAGAVYPRRHERLAQQISQSGCLVTEYPPGIPALAYHFPSRNRIVTGLSRGVLVVEAAEASGSLISARLAMEQGREVFAVPGSILSKQSEGCHKLIRQGAKLAANVADILEEFHDFEIKRHRRVKVYTVQEEAVLSELRRSTCHADKLHEVTGIAVPELMAVLINLEIQGAISVTPMGYQLASDLES